MMADRVLGLLFFILALAMIWASMGVSGGTLIDPLGPRAFPVFIAAMMAIAAVIVFFKPDIGEEWPRAGKIIELVAIVGLFIAYALTLEKLGFTTATSMLAIILSWRLGANPVTAIITGIVIALVAMALFHYVLGLSLPGGFIGI